MAARHQENVRENNADVEKKNNMAEKRFADSSKEDACAIEHVLSEMTYSKVKEYVKNTEK